MCVVLLGSKFLDRHVQEFDGIVHCEPRGRRRCYSDLLVLSSAITNESSNHTNVVLNVARIGLILQLETRKLPPVRDEPINPHHIVWYVVLNTTEVKA